MARKPAKKKTLGRKTMKTTKGGTFHTSFKGGVTVSAGDINNDGAALIQPSPGLRG